MHPWGRAEVAMTTADTQAQEEEEREEGRGRLHGEGGSVNLPRPARQEAGS